MGRLWPGRPFFACGLSTFFGVHNGTALPTSTRYAGVLMVESNHDEERFARVEHMIEALQRESAALKVLTAKLVLAVAVPTRAPVKPQRQPVFALRSQSGR